MTTTLNIPIEKGLSDVVDEIVDENYNAKKTEVARDFIKLGLDIERTGNGLQVRGPGGPRPFAKLDLGDEKKTVSTSVPDDLAERIKEVFGEGADPQLHPAARKALRTGIAAVRSPEMTIEGPLGFPRPFAYIEPPEESDFDDEEARERLRWLKGSGEPKRSSVVLEGEVDGNGSIDVDDLEETPFEAGDKVRMLVTDHENE